MAKQSQEQAFKIAISHSVLKLFHYFTILWLCMRRSLVAVNKMLAHFSA
jgi:hypothetical protein